MVYFPRKTQLFGKIETTPGTDAHGAAQPAAATFIPGLVSLDIELQGEKNISEQLRSSFTPALGNGMSGLHWKITAELELRGGGSQSSPTVNQPYWGPLLLASGHTYTAGVYAPSTTTTNSATLYAYKDGLLYIMTYCKFKWSLSAENGKHVRIKFEGMGLYTGLPTDSTGGTYYAPPTVTDSHAVPVVAKSCSFSVGGISSSEMTATKFEFDGGQVVEVSPDLNATNGIKATQITDRKSTVKFDPEWLTKAEFDHYNAVIASGTNTWAITFNGGTNNTFVLGGTSSLEFDTVKDGERQGKMSAETEGRLASSTADGEYTLTIS